MLPAEVHLALTNDLKISVPHYPTVTRVTTIM